MTLPTSGPINMSQVDVEIGRAPDALIYLGEAEVRDLADVPTGQIFLSNLYGKSFQYPVYGPGTHYFTVPTGVNNLNIIKLVAGGGGGSGTNGAGDIWGGGGGGSGGYHVGETLAVTPGEVLQFIVGFGGNSGLVTFNGPTLCAGTSGSTVGTNGGFTKIVRNYNTTPITLLEATGGITGLPAPNGDNGPGDPGAGGVPNGVAGGYQSPIQRNDFAAGLGGNNGTGYGGGGAGNGTVPFTCPTKGGHGYLSISWPLTVVAFGDPTVNTSTGTRSGGSFSFTIPSSVYTIIINAVGGGGPGYAYHDGGYCQHAWAGSPGGGATIELSVSPGDVISGYYGNAGGSGYYNGGQGGGGSATTVYKNGALIATCYPGDGGSGTPGALGTAVIEAPFSGTTYTGTAQSGWLNACDGSYPPYNHYDPWSWVLAGSYAQSVLGTVAIQPPSVLGANYQRAGMPQVCGWVSITY
jgi:hypothetical protein